MKRIEADIITHSATVLIGGKADKEVIDMPHHHIHFEPIKREDLMAVMLNPDEYTPIEIDREEYHRMPIRVGQAEFAVYHQKDMPKEMVMLKLITAYAELGDVK